MRKKDVNKILNAGFKESLKTLGFKKTKNEFLKKYDNFSIRFGYAIVDYYNLFPTTFGYGLYMKEYDNLIGRIEGREINNRNVYGRNTISLFVKGNYPIKEYTITTEEDTLNMVKEVTAYMKNVAIPYLESISNFSALDKIYNENPTRPEFGVRGLILAKMAQNPQYDKLKKAYRQLFVDKNWAVQEDIDNLEKTIQFLDNHTLEQLQKIASNG